MTTAHLATATGWFVAYVGYVLVAGMGTFWAVVWPEGHAVRRLRGLAVVGGGLVGLSTVAEIVLGRVVVTESSGGTVADASETWPLARLAVLAAAGFFGPELLRRPVRGVRRLALLVLVVALTVTLVVESTAAASPQVVAIATTTTAYLLALATWLGSLVALAALLIPRHQPERLERVWTRFSWVAGVSVVLVAATGAMEYLISGATVTARSGVLLIIEAPVLVGTWVLSRYAVRYGRRLAFRERYLRGLTVAGSGQRPRLGRTIGVQMIMGIALLAMTVAQLVVMPVPGRPGTPPLGEPVPTTPVTTAGEARLAPGEPRRFIPERIALAGGAAAAVVPIATVGHELVVPADGDKVGWWDGSSYVGDQYGSTVIAGHVDTVDGGLGFFFALWNVKRGERVVLTAGDHRQAYQITRLRQVPRTDLVDDEEVFDIRGRPRLVLITCAGDFDAERGGYSRNLVVVARPVG